MSNANPTVLAWIEDMKRHRLAVTQREAAALLGISEGHLTRLKRGAKPLSLTMRLAMRALSHRLLPW